MFNISIFKNYKKKAIKHYFILVIPSLKKDLIKVESFYIKNVQISTSLIRKFSNINSANLKDFYLKILTL